MLTGLFIPIISELEVYNEKGVNMNIRENVFVSFDYRLTLDSGEEVDKSKPGNPLGFITGAGQIIPGLESKMMGMTVGDSARISVEPENAYGLINPQLFQEIRRDQFPADIEIKPGMTFQSHGPQGPMIIKVKEVNDKGAVVIDLNHPLAGERLHFDVNIAEVRQLTPEEKDGLISSCGCDCGSDHTGGCGSGGCGSEGSCCH
jgi:FKBP-type peptidyl-prolyl cis-trans isomerase SlyD